jgi:hypothetical protein
LSCLHTSFCSLEVTNVVCGWLIGRGEGRAFVEVAFLRGVSYCWHCSHGIARKMGVSINDIFIMRLINTPLSAWIVMIPP